MPRAANQLNILTWHIHGSYLYYLSRIPHRIFLPKKWRAEQGYGGRTASFAWPDNVIEVDAKEVADLDLDCVLFQSQKNYEYDQYEILSPQQQRLPRIYLEHDPPREHPTDTLHPVQDPNALLVHVTPFNRLMWDSGNTPTRVIEHGVHVSASARYTGEIESGLTVVNNLSRRGRRLGADIFDDLRHRVPLDLVGMGWQEAHGIGEIPPMHLPAFAASYRFLFNPIRYTSLGLAVIESMLVGLPVVGLATTQLATVVENGVSGFVETDPEALVAPMKRLLREPALARRMGEAGRRYATQRFGIDRFVRDWNAVLAEAVGRRTVRPYSAPRRPIAVPARLSA
jgi:glycosyltransferase involved in cell wall biosynthesis